MQFQNFWRRSIQLSHDGGSLMLALWQAPPHQRREVFLKLGSGTNAVARNALLVEKEVNSLRYYGIIGYLRERKYIKALSTSHLQFSASGTESAGSDNPKDTRSTSPKVAKVAFMITSSMRDELKERLHFTSEEIKQLTPVEASLVLEYNVVAAEVGQKLPALLEEHRKNQKRLHEAAKVVSSNTHEPADVPRSSRDQEIQRLEAEQETTSTPEEGKNPMQITEGFVSRCELLKGNENYVESDLLDTASIPADGLTKWYQVLERKDSGEVEVVALYLSEKDAIFGQQIHQELATKKNESNVRFTVCTVLKP